MSRGRRGQRTSHAASALLLHTPASSPPKPPPMKLGGCKDGGGGAPSPSLVVKPDGTPARQELRLGAGDEEKRPAVARSGAVEAGSGPPWRDLLGGGVGRLQAGGLVLPQPFGHHFPLSACSWHSALWLGVLDSKAA
uniref:Uncharacterized protein n=1 Tax=Oryza nivara TaxID=4536 RepID=A0A0E0IB32_ORYNI